MSTIFAVSSGRAPAAIAVIRCSGPDAFAAGKALAGPLPPPRSASLRKLRDSDGELLDSALVLCFPGPNTATGEDVVEFHCHGGRAVVAAVERALLRQPGLTRAEPGEFTRRALMYGRIDLLEAEGLADLLEAETEAQRLAAVAAVEGRLSAQVRGWMDEIAGLSARVEATLDFADDADVSDEADVLSAIVRDMATLRGSIEATLAAPSVERLREGVRVVIAGPPNVGKSTLLNALSEREAAIVSPVSGTTRDRIEAGVVRGGSAFLLVDTAGLTATEDPVEAIGVARAHDAIAFAELLLWLGDDAPPRPDVIWVHARNDLAGRRDTPPGRDVAVSTCDDASYAALWTMIHDRSQALLGSATDMPALRRLQREAYAEVAIALDCGSRDPILLAEGLATARRRLAQVLGLDATETMLDALFGRFCLGK